jgi:methylenetetrahydrofolate dehydrogenase (NADP+)/methenyltetrahydrofolate cyclohydrolase
MAGIIDGNLVAQKIHEQTALEAKNLREEYGIQPGLAVVLIGEDAASKVYVTMKEKKSKELGFYSVKEVLPHNATMDEVLKLVNRLNNDNRVDGILVQSPPPYQIDEDKVINAINPTKDVDCFHPINVGKMLIGKEDGFYPCTPHGVMKLLEYSKVDPAGKHAVIIGRSNIVGKPMMALLIQKAKGANATVTVCHSRTPNIKEFSSKADILIAAIGKAEFVKADMVKEGAVVIDVGINRVEDASSPRGYKLVGDVAFNEVKDKVSLISPVPGGVGPMTIAMLMHNTVKACKQHHGIK